MADSKLSVDTGHHQDQQPIREGQDYQHDGVAQVESPPVNPPNQAANLEGQDYQHDGVAQVESPPVNPPNQAANLFDFQGQNLDSEILYFSDNQGIFIPVIEIDNYYHEQLLNYL
ncbi:hypothetical protein Pcinc_030746 [Petrolisthes cinctipes]|uniref:Uncharacterized protein n=1 Tax=Petrolisthes cinctipes TaxID=88211 RepID=A0AAE1EY38_PETCI|nr:hypothetical protein Pcinc_030746 [Petrolisthes cinctipes]KAK3863492.1 hypothetical protein Pcinc_030746 [Petrolisthes cinctipes]